MTGAMKMPIKQRKTNNLPDVSRDLTQEEAKFFLRKIKVFKTSCRNSEKPEVHYG
jgi:hypothetical protein